ncbi:MAG: o-succinylbenzoate--CoA ligase [Anaerolineaceae bacterium]|nr:o-succinylbenzoate--CoA ligase [Anaerolineaceae bacterium]
MQDWLEARAKATPHKTALNFDGQSLTFRMLHEQVSLMSEQWHAAGIVPGQVVGLLAFSHPLVVVQIFTAMRVGAILVPLNLRLTIAEMAAQLRQADAAGLLPYGDAEQLRALRGAGIRVITFNTRLPQPNQRNPHIKEHIDLDAAFAIIHTSGTSGKPKGAVLTYGNFFYSAMASAYRLGHSPDDRWLCVLPLYHVGGLSILMRAVLYGITVDLHERFDLDAINHALDTQPITLISLVPTMLHRLLESRTHWPQSLRLILLGGAAASPELLTRCRELSLPVATTYGLTEACSQVATMLPQDALHKPGSVGKPLLLMNIRIVNNNSEPVTAGEYGEIVVSGPTIMRGYFNDAESTAQVLRDGWLHTGDIGYLDDDDDLWVVQRRSDLIVTGGENVYPAEVEQVMRQHPAVEDVCVVGVDDPEWGQQVAAAVVLADAGLSEAELLAFCREHLAGYKLPRRLLFVNALPQTASGKVQRVAVKDLFTSKP